MSKFDLLQAFQDDARSAAPRYQIFTFQKRVVEKAPAPVFRRFSLQLGDVKDVAMCSSHDMCLKILKKNVPVQIQKFVSLLNMKIRLGFWMDNRSTRKRGISHCQCFARFSPSPLFTPQKTSKIFDKSIVHGSQHLLKPQLPTTKKTTDNQSFIHLEGLLETIHGPLAFHCRSDFSNLSMKWKKCVRNVGDLFVVLIIFFFWLAGPGIAFWFAFGDWRRESLKKSQTSVETTGLAQAKPASNGSSQLNCPTLEVRIKDEFEIFSRFSSIWVPNTRNLPPNFVIS